MGQAPRCRPSCSPQRTVWWLFLISPPRPPNGPCLLTWETHRKKLFNRELQWGAACTATSGARLRTTSCLQLYHREGRRIGLLDAQQELYRCSFPTFWGKIQESTTTWFSESLFNKLCMSFIWNQSYKQLILYLLSSTRSSTCWLCVLVPVWTGIVSLLCVECCFQPADIFKKAIIHKL